MTSIAPSPAPAAAAAPQAPAASTPSPSRSPQRGDWPYTSNPAPRIDEARYQQVLAAVPDRTLPASVGTSFDTPDKTATWLMYGFNDAQYAGTLMQKGVAGDPQGFAYNATSTARYGTLAVTGLNAWLRSDPAKTTVIRQLLDASSNVEVLATEFAARPVKDDVYRSRDRAMADALGSYMRVTRDALQLLQDESRVRKVPIA